MDKTTSRKSIQAIIAHLLCLAVYYLGEWALHTAIPSSRYAYWLLLTLDDFRHWYPHGYFIVYGAIHALYVVPYLALAFSFAWLDRLRLFPRWHLFGFFFVCAICFIFFRSHYYWVSTLLLLFMLGAIAEAQQSLWETVSSRRLIVGFILLSLILRVAWVFISDNNDNGDAAARLYVADIWLRLCCHFPSRFPVYAINPSYDWLPLPFYLSGTSMFLTGDAFFAPRFVTVIFGVLSVIPMFLIARHRFGQTTAIAAALIFTCYLQHIILSSQTLSEPFYLFFLLWAYYFIERIFTESDKDRNALLAGLSLACCCLVRYEGWVFTGLALLILPFTRLLSYRSLFKLATAPAIAMICIMLLEMASGQHPLRGILYSDYEVALTYLTGESKYLDVLSNLPVAYLPLFTLAMIASFYQELQADRKKSIPLFLLYWLTIVPFVIKIANQTLTCQSRYLSIYMVPVIPFIAHLLVSVTCRIRLNKYTFAIVIISYIALANTLMTEKVKNDLAYLRYPKGFLNSAAYVREHIAHSQLYLDYINDLGTNSWSVYAKTMDIHRIYYQIDSNYLRRNEHQIDSTFRDAFPRQCIVRVQDKTEYSLPTFSKLLAENKISHLMLSPEGYLSRELKFSHPVEIYNGRTFKQLFSENGYLIYEVQMPD